MYPYGKRGDVVNILVGVLLYLLHHLHLLH